MKLQNIIVLALAGIVCFVLAQNNHNLPAQATEKITTAEIVGACPDLLPVKQTVADLQLKVEDNSSMIAAQAIELIKLQKEFEAYKAKTDSDISDALSKQCDCNNKKAVPSAPVTTPAVASQNSSVIVETYPAVNSSQSSGACYNGRCYQQSSPQQYYTYPRARLFGR